MNLGEESTMVKNIAAGFWAGVLLCLLVPASTFAQGGIAGVVKDTTGAVLPGVTVEAASPALIEKVRTVVSDGEGLYKIVDLRPGVYTVTFTLLGFSTVRREGIELTASFPATVNGARRVGCGEETVTVRGQSSTVDTQQVVQQRVLTRNVMDDVPVGTKTIAAMGALIPGMVASVQDVGGTGGSSGQTIAIHNSRNGEEQLLQDGMTYNTGNGRGGGFSAVRANEASTQEIAIETSGLMAESELSGVRTNVIPKEGGNSFKSYTNFRYGNHSMQSNNLSQALKSRGLASPDSLDFIMNTTQGCGGPIKKDKLRSEEHTSELQSHSELVCRLLLEKKNKTKNDFNVATVASERRGNACDQFRSGCVEIAVLDFWHHVYTSNQPTTCVRLYRKENVDG